MLPATAESSPDQRFLIAAPTGRDARLTSSVLARAGVDSFACASIDELHREATRGCAGLLLAEEVLLPTTVRRLAEFIDTQEPWSDLPVMLLTAEDTNTRTRGPTPTILASLGNVTLLERPLRPMTMVTAVQSALRARRRQYETRRLLAGQAEGLRQRDEFLAMLGHELRNPLGVILFSVDVLERGGPERAARYPATIRRQARHLARLVDDLLDVSRVTSGKIVLQTQPLELGELLRRCLEAFEARAHDVHTPRHQRLELHTPAQPVLLDGDEVRLEQVFTNLIGNAVKYTPAGGHISVTLTLDDDNAHICVLDDGLGIAPEMLPYVFDLFAQAKRTLDRSQGGLGIGLTLVRTLVNLHGGSVAAHSPGLGRGCAFTVHLPLTAPRA